MVIQAKRERAILERNSPRNSLRADANVGKRSVAPTMLLLIFASGSYALKNSSINLFFLISDIPL
jgi:hypothetical protein